MTQVAIVPEVLSAEVLYLPHVHIAEAEKLLQEIRPLDRVNLSLDLLSIYHQKIDWFIKNFPKGFCAQQILPELKSRRLAYAISIERRQSQIV